MESSLKLFMKTNPNTREIWIHMSSFNSEQKSKRKQCIKLFLIEKQLSCSAIVFYSTIFEEISYQKIKEVV